MHEVGQVIFLVSKKTQSVIAAQICEQIVKKTLSGEETTFRVMLSGVDTNDNTKTYDLSQIDADIYDSPEAASESLYNAARTAIDGLINSAVKDAETKFEYVSKAKIFPSTEAKKPDDVNQSKTKTDQKTTKNSKKNSSEKSDDYIFMPDGTKARLTTPLETLEKAINAQGV